MDDFLTCPICGARKHNLTKHIMMAHKYTLEQVKEEFSDIKLVSDSTSCKLSEANRRNWANDPDYRERCSSYWRSDLHAQRKSRDMKAMWNDPEKHEQMQQGIKRYANSYEGRKKRSETATETATRRLKDLGPLGVIGDINGRFSTPVTYNGITFRSLFESYFAMLFETMNLRYEFETIVLPYTNDEGHPKNYILDFYLPDYNVVVEIKPNKFLDELEHGKRVAAESSSYTYWILTEDDLNEDAVNERLLKLSRADNLSTAPM